MDLRAPSDLDGFNWAFLAMAIVLAGLHLYLGLVEPADSGRRSSQFVIIGVAFLVGPLIYFTDYWRPILYLFGATVAAYVGVLWLLSGMENLRFGVVAAIAETALILLGVYLFLREETFTSGGRRRRGL